MTAAAKGLVILAGAGIGGWLGFKVLPYFMPQSGPSEEEVVSRMLFTPIPSIV